MTKAEEKLVRWAAAVVPHYDAEQAVAWFGKGKTFEAFTVQDLKELADQCRTEQPTFLP